jgi:hypothetical protein
MEAVTLSGNDFKTIHNTLCELRSLVQRMDESVIKVERFEEIIESFERGLKDAYDQDSGAFDRKHDYYNRFREDNGLTTIWSVYELEEHGFMLDHPWKGAKVLAYWSATALIQGPTWGDLYRAANEVIQRSGDSHHIFIEGFAPYGTDNSMLKLTTGS